MLGGSWVVVSRVLLLITRLTTTHELRSGEKASALCWFTGFRFEARCRGASERSLCPKLDQSSTHKGSSKGSFEGSIWDLWEFRVY